MPHCIGIGRHKPETLNPDLTWISISCMQSCRLTHFLLPPIPNWPTYYCPPVVLHHLSLQPTPNSDPHLWPRDPLIITLNPSPMNLIMLAPPGSLCYCPMYPGWKYCVANTKEYQDATTLLNLNYNHLKNIFLQMSDKIRNGWFTMVGQSTQKTIFQLFCSLDAYILIQ